MKKYMDLFNSSVYAFDSEDSILEAKDIGIAADICSVMTPDSTVFAMKSHQGCPYTNTAFTFDLKVGGETVRCRSWKWLPNAIVRSGGTRRFDVATLTAVVPKTRTVILRVTLTNKTGDVLRLPIAAAYRGGVRFESDWQFKIPDPEPAARESYRDEDGILSLAKNGCAFRITSSLEGMRLFDRAYLWENEITLTGAPLTFYFAVSMGEEGASLLEARKIREDYESRINESFEYLLGEIDRIDKNLPKLKTDSPELDRLYYRSLVTYILCRWDNPDLCAVPYYSTGSVTGGCMCSYLWDYCGGLMLHPVYDFEGNKVQLRAYLKNDLTTSYALNPATAGPVGPWYPINQEKIICMVYYHILATSDKDFLFEKVGDRTVLEWMRYHAYVCDDTAKDVELYDYGNRGDSHLELHHRGNGPYNGIMPDLNARRYMNYMRVYELTKLAGEPDEELMRRAAALRERLKSLWNEELGWYDFIDANGNRDVRYTVQMFKFLNSGVIDDKTRKALIEHLNECEFLSEFGLHSMSKLDSQYDQDDIDNGGGGICTHFTMQICAQLYEVGYDELATDILRRVYWWGERLPYMGDSCAANMIMNREDTPLQGDISSVSCAQMIFFFIFGIKAQFDGSIKISPVKHRPAENMKITNARLCGKVFSVEITGERFTVSLDGASISATIGETVTI